MSDSRQTRGVLRHQNRAMRPATGSQQEAATAPVDVPTLVAALITVTLWGSAFAGIRAAGQTFSPGGLAVGRLLVSTAVLGAVTLFRRQPLPQRRDLVGIAVYGVLWLGVYSVALNAAERLVDAGTAAMLIASGPILIALLGGLFLGEGFPRNLFLGSAVAFAGSLLIGFATAPGGNRKASGIFLCAVAVLAYSVAVVVQKRVLRRVSPLQVTALGSAAATLACLPFLPALVGDVARSHLAAIGWVIYLGAMPTALGFMTWTFALRRSSAGRTGSFLYIVPVVAIVLGWGLLSEVPPWLAIAGGVLCLAGVYLARRVNRPTQRPPGLLADPSGSKLTALSTGLSPAQERGALLRRG
jgi:drug/metabolite transporter (DMT)-like permease